MMLELRPLPWVSSAYDRNLFARVHFDKVEAFQGKLGRVFVFGEHFEQNEIVFLLADVHQMVDFALVLDRGWSS
jgi:hypothetical protein